MKRYVIVVFHENGRQSLLNQVLFLNRKEAEQTARWHEIKIESEKKLSEKFWGEPIVLGKADLRIAEVKL